MVSVGLLDSMNTLEANSSLEPGKAAIFWDAFSELVTEQLVARDRSFDVISGVAGSAGALAP